MLDGYKAYLQQQSDLSDKTIRAYLSDLQDFVSWFEQWSEQSFDPAAVATPTITRYRATLAERLKPASINRRLVAIKRFFAWAVENGFLDRDPSRVVKQVAEVAAPPRHLTDREEAALVAAVSKYGTARDYAIIVLMFHTGLRAAEVCDLKPTDVQISARSGLLVVRQGKGSKRREIPLNSTARKALASYLDSIEDAVYLFPGAKSGRLTERALGYLIEKYAHLAKVEDVSPHDLRHRFGYRMAEQTPLHRVAQLMGHDSLNTTMIYVGATAKDLQGEVEKIAWE